MIQTVRLTELEKKLMVGEGGERVKEDIVLEFGVDMYTLLYLKWTTNKYLLYSTWNSAQCYVPAWMGRGVGGEWVHVYVWLGSLILSLFTVHLILSQHSESAISSVQFSSVAQSRLTLCNPMNCSTPGLPVHHHLPEFTQTHVH